MLRRFSIIYLIPLLASPIGAVKESSEFHEELYVRPMANGYVNTFFQFTTRWHYGDRENLHNTQLIPRPIAETLLLYDVKELHIGLTQGLWRYETFGFPVVDAAPGAEMWAWFAGENLTTSEVDDQWTKLASTFSGILCASLNFIDKTNSVEPKFSFRPQFVIGSKVNVPQYIRYASLPREIVCTENLTPWKKLLPCNSKQGFASLLNSGYVHNTNYHSLGIKMRTICESYNKNCILEFTETANLVYDPKLLGTNGDFSLRRLFGQGLNGYCSLSKSSKIYVNLDDQPYDLTPTPMHNLTSKRGGTTTSYGVYDIQRLDADKLFNIAWISRKSNPAILITPSPPIYAHRYILGHGQERGQIVTQVTNKHYSKLPIVLQENIPWFVPSYMHTLNLVVQKENGADYRIRPLVMHYIPGVQRVRPYHLELVFEIPPRSTVQVSFDFDYIFLKWLEYPPDANHGHYLGSAIITTQLPIGRNYSTIPVDKYLFADSFNASRPSYFLEIRTESLILSLPTPDFSMPYNVICLACTVVALAFGPIHSVATKRIVVEHKDAPPQSLIGKVWQKLFKRKQKETDNGTSQIEEHDEMLFGHSNAQILHQKFE
ncbi:PREDICTED: GPI transamidase component PIG-T isoform X2 [Rhagoletis zephyria]|uniref:GPI transamidase component PIG-T isoform X2 n=1 Tax=Rhagoletis zephyria TaxID=28612 RepID=UPI000811A6F1|nr:PREDICTED: GPI transamidase component PIG-T isoform X2 [Rhagoletis zephyria]